MESIVLRNWDIQEESMEELVGYAGITAKYAASLLGNLDFSSSQDAINHATKFIVEIALVDLGRTLELLAEEAARREGESEADTLEEVKSALPHMMEQMLANLEAERSAKEGAA